VEASALTHAQKRGLFARRSPLLKFQEDSHLVALTRRGHQHAFEMLVERYQSRLLGFCRQMLGSTEDAEDVLQEVFVAAYNAMVADEREIAVRPWLYRIARNRCLNHLRKPTADGQDTMDEHPHMHGVTTLERVQTREEFRSLLEDVSHLPETQRSALLLREIDAMSYEEIAQAMDTTVPGVKSLLVRARIALAESSQARQLTCDEVRVQLAEAAEGLAKLDGAARRHVKACENCEKFRKELRKNSKVLAALFPAGPLIALKGVIAAKLTGLFGGGAGGGGAAAGGAGAGVTATGAGAGAAAAGGTATGAAVAGGAAASAGAAAGAGGAAGAVGAAIGTKAAAGLATAALLAGGAVEVKQVVDKDPSKPAASKSVDATPKPEPAPFLPPPVQAETPPAATEPATPPAVAEPEEVIVEPVPVETTDPAEPGGVAPATKGKGDEPIASTDGSDGSGHATGGPITTGIATECDPDGDGISDPACDTTSDSGLEQVEQAPQPVKPRKIVKRKAPATTNRSAPAKKPAVKQVTRKRK
jgi:RNA polymerase sigma factor (sigma-70 family)